MYRHNDVEGVNMYSGQLRFLQTKGCLPYSLGSRSRIGITHLLKVVYFCPEQPWFPHAESYIYIYPLNIFYF